jgi:integrase/recombinase XerD
LEIIVATSTELEVCLRRWLIWLRADDKAASTLEQYGYQLERLRVWLAERGIERPDQLERPVLEEYLAELHGVWAAATVRQAVSAARSFVRWLRRERWIDKKRKRRLLKALKPPRSSQKHAQRTLTIAEVQTLLARCDPETTKGVRDAALIGLLLDSGLRAREIRRLRLRDLEFGVRLAPGPEGWIEVNRVLAEIKGDKRRYGYMGQRTAGLLQRWLNARQAVARPGEEALFVSVGGTTPGAAFSRYGLRAILKRLGRQAQLNGVSPHAFRRAFACVMELAGASTRTTQILGRWENLEMVIHYQRDLEAALQYNQFAPLDFIERLDKRPDS